jgi:hypothetical protein
MGQSSLVDYDNLLLKETTKCAVVRCVSVRIW